MNGKFSSRNILVIFVLLILPISGPSNIVDNNNLSDKSVIPDDLNNGEDKDVKLSISPMPPRKFGAAQLKFEQSLLFENSDILTTNTDDARHPDIKADQNNNLFVVWDSGDNKYSGRPASVGDVYGSFWNASKATSPSDNSAWDVEAVLLSSETTEGSYEPAIAIDSTGIVHLVYQSHDFGTGNENIWYKTWDVKTGTITSPIKLTSNVGTDARFAKIEVDSGDNLHVVYESNKNIGFNGNDIDILYRYWDNGLNQWENEVVISNGSDYDSRWPSATIDINDRFNVVWEDNISSSPIEVGIFGNDFDIFYSNKTGTQWSSPQRISISSTENSSEPVIISDNDSNLYVAWSEGPSSTTGNDILYKTYNPKTDQWTSSEVVSNAGSNNTRLPDLAIDINNNIHLTWVEEDSSQIPFISYRFKDYITQSWKTKRLVSFESDDIASRPSVISSSNRTYFVWDDISNVQGSGSDFDILLSVSKFNVNGPTFDQLPEDQVIIAGEFFNYDINVTDIYGIDKWSINNTFAFSIDQNGVITNATSLGLGSYGLRIQVNNTLGFTAIYSITLVVRTPDPEVPSVPREVQISYSEDGVSLTWLKPQFSIGSAVKSYSIYRAVDLGGFVFLTSTPLTNYLDSSNIIRGSIYSYKISAENDLGLGPQTDAVSIRAVTVPSAPLSLGVTFDGTSINLVWIEPADLGGEPLIKYNIYKSISDSVSYQLLNDTDVSDYNDNDFAFGNTYFYKITAVNSVGESILSDEVSITLIIETSTDTDTEPSSTSTGDTKLGTTSTGGGNLPVPINQTIIIVVVAVVGGITTIIIIIIRRKNR